MKRVLSLILATAMLAAALAFAGCGNTDVETTPSAETTVTTPSGSTPAEQTTAGGDTTEPTTGTTEPEETTDTSATEPLVPADPFDNYDGTTKLPGFESVDFRNEEFVIVGNNNATYAFSKTASKEVISDGSDAISVAIRFRNSVIEKLYNCKIVLEEAEEPYNIAAADVVGNKQHVDLFMLGSHDIMKRSAAGNMYNLLTFDIDMSNPWWDHNFTESTAIKNANGEKSLTGVIGDFSLFSMSCTYSLMFNKRVYESKGIESKVGNIYQMVKTNKWTLDTMAEMVKAAATEVSGNSTLHASEGDVMGWLYTDQVGNALMMASGLTFIDNVDGELKFTAGDNAAAWDTAITKSIEIFALPEAETAGYNDIPTYVGADQVLFVSEVLDVLARWKDYDIEMGLVPYPKHSESQENYANFVEGHYQVLCVPVSVTEIGDVANFLEIYAGHSKYIVRPAWVEAYSYEYCNDLESGEMLDIILNARVYDPCYTFESLRRLFNEVGGMVTSEKNNFTKWVGRNVDTANQLIRDIVTTRKR